MTLALRLTAALREETLVLPEAGAVLVMRGRAGEIGDAIPHARLVVEQPFRPDYDALAAAGLRVVRHAEGPATMVVVVAGRSRPRSLGDVARGLRLLAPGAVLALDGAKTDGIEALARQIATEMPLAGHVAKAHGRLVWLHRPETLPPAVADWEGDSLPLRACSPPRVPIPAANGWPRISTGVCAAESPSSAQAGAGSRPRRWRVART